MTTVFLSFGRVDGGRVHVDQVPRLPTFPSGGSWRILEPVEGNGVRVTSQMTIEVEGQDKPALVAETLGVRYA